MAKVIIAESEGIEFDNGFKLYSDHEQDCCEHHWLYFENLKLDDFEGLEFDLSNDNFFEKVEGYGIRLIPTNGHPISVPGYGSNNGYSSNLTLVLSGAGFERKIDISECQVISD